MSSDEDDDLFGGSVEEDVRSAVAEAKAQEGSSGGARAGDGVSAAGASGGNGAVQQVPCPPGKGFYDTYSGTKFSRALDGNGQPIWYMGRAPGAKQDEPYARFKHSKTGYEFGVPGNAPNLATLKVRLGPAHEREAARRAKATGVKMDAEDAKVSFGLQKIERGMRVVQAGLKEADTANRESMALRVQQGAALDAASGADTLSAPAASASAASADPQAAAPASVAGGDDESSSDSDGKSDEAPKKKMKMPSLECPICMVPISSAKDSVATPCGHKFHMSCLQKWQNSGNNQCPSCRTALPAGQSPAPAAASAADDHIFPETCVYCGDVGIAMMPLSVKCECMSMHAHQVCLERYWRPRIGTQDGPQKPHRRTYCRGCKPTRSLHQTPYTILDAHRDQVSNGGDMQTWADSSSVVSQRERRAEVRAAGQSAECQKKMKCVARPLSSKVDADPRSTLNWQHDSRGRYFLTGIRKQKRMRRAVMRPLRSSTVNAI